MARKKGLGWKIFAIVIGAVVILSLGKPAADKAKDLLKGNGSDTQTEESVEDTTTAASINNFYEVC